MFVELDSLGDEIKEAFMKNYIWQNLILKGKFNTKKIKLFFKTCEETYLPLK